MNEFQNRKILIAEDEPDSRRILRFFLESLDYLVIEAEDGKQAVRLAQSELPDLILMDLNMPQLDGITAAMIIRQLKQLCEVPILATSGDGGRGIELFLNIRQMGTGYVGYLTKPINLEELAEQIAILLARARKAA